MRYILYSANCYFYLMACYLRVSGKDFDVDKFITESEFKDWDRKDLQISYKGETSGPRKRPLETNGFQIHISDTDFQNFAKQQKDAFAFLSKYQESFMKLAPFGSFEWRHLDFGMDGWPPNGFTRTYTISDELMKLCSQLNIGIEISTYFSTREKRRKGRAKRNFRRFKK